jgi:DNA-binding transcriptional LysR family regulator
MELRHLKYFQAVAEELSFSRAAERLRIAQPAVSRAVKELEEELGIELLERTRSWVRMRPAGAVLLREVGRLEEMLGEALERVRRTAKGEEGELRLGYIGPPTRPFLGRVLGEFRRRFPKVSVHLEERTPERVWEMVAKGRLAAGLTRPVPLSQDLGLRTLVLREERLGVVVPLDHAWAGRRSLRWALLEREALVVLARREGVGLHDAMLAGCRAAGFAPRLVQTPSLIGTVLSYVEAGMGLGVVTDSVAWGELPVRFVPLVPEVTVPLVLVWREDEETPQLLRLRELLEAWRRDGRLWRDAHARRKPSVLPPPELSGRVPRIVKPGASPMAADNRLSEG